MACLRPHPYLAPVPTLLGRTDRCCVPAASVSGLYFSHHEATYFSVGRIGRDQLESYARRKGMSIEDAERWLGPNLAYNPVELGVKC